MIEISFEKDLIFKITINDLTYKKSQDMILELKVWIFLNKQVTNFKFLTQNINCLCYFRKFDIKIRKRFLKFLKITKKFEKDLIFEKDFEKDKIFKLKIWFDS